MFTLNLVLLVVLASTAYTVADKLECVKPKDSQASFYEDSDTCYAYYSKKEDFQKAQDICKKQHGGSLAMPKDQSDQNFLSKDILGDVSSDTSPVWIGLSDQKEEGQFVWMDGKPLKDGDYNLWERNEKPDHIFEGIAMTLNCVAMRHNGANYYWQDFPCRQSFGLGRKRFICQFDPTNTE